MFINMYVIIIYIYNIAMGWLLLAVSSSFCLEDLEFVSSV